MQLSRLLLLPLLAVSVMACDDDDPIGPGGDVALVRFVNAAAGTADVQVLRTGATTPLVADLDFRGSSAACVQVPAGSQQTLTFRSGTTDLATKQFTFEEGERYTVILSANGATRLATVLEDETAVTAGNRGVRFFNASASAGDVYIYEAGGAMGAADIEDLVVVGAASAAPQYLLRPQAQSAVRFFDPGVSTGTPRGEVTLAAPTGRRLSTVVFTEAGTPAGATAWVVGAC